MAFSPEALAVEKKVRPKFGPAGAPLAVPLSLDHAYFQNPRNEHRWQTLYRWELLDSLQPDLLRYR